MATFTVEQRALLRAISPSIVPEAGTLDDEAAGAMLDLIENEVGRRGRDVQRQLALFLRLVEWLPAARYGRRLSRLPLVRQSAWLAFLQRCPIQLVRSGFWGLRTLILLGFYGRPDAAAVIGYAPGARGNAVLHDRA